MQPIARVVRIYRYLVKSMAAQPLEQTRLDWHGVVGDRRFAFRRLAAPGGFPWLTATRFPALVRYRPTCDGGADASIAANIRVGTPEGETLALDDSALRDRVSAAYGHDVELMQLDRGTFDEASISAISTQTIAAIAGGVGRMLDPRRFRPNLVVELTAATGSTEDAWLGRRIVFDVPDGAAIVVTQRDARCSMINLDPDTGASDPRVLKTVVRGLANLAGVYGVITQPGEVKVGSVLYALEPAPAARAGEPGMRTAH